MGLSQMSGTVMALDEVTRSGNCEACERGAGCHQKELTDSIVQIEKDEAEKGCSFCQILSDLMI